MADYIIDEYGNYISDENGDRVISSASGASDIDFTLDDVSASSVGISLQRPVSFSAAVPRVSTVKIAGKSGDLHIDQQSYENRKGEALCFALSENVTDKMSEITRFLFSQKGYIKLRTHDDPNHYWQARIANAGEIAARLSLLNPFTIEFDCKPYRQLVSGDEELTPTSSSIITNNTGFDAEPLIYFTASGAGAIGINGDVVNINGAMSGTIVMDCELWTIYPEGRQRYLSYNKLVSSEYFPVLAKGVNSITWSGGVSVTKLIPRWRTL